MEKHATFSWANSDKWNQVKKIIQNMVSLAEVWWIKVQIYQYPHVENQPVVKDYTHWLATAFFSKTFQTTK